MNDLMTDFSKIADQIVEKHFSYDSDLADDVRNLLLVGHEYGEEDRGFNRFAEAFGLEQAIRIFSDFLNEDTVLALEENWMEQHWVR